MNNQIIHKWGFSRPIIKFSLQAQLLFSLPSFPWTCLLWRHPGDRWHWSITSSDGSTDRCVSLASDLPPPSPHHHAMSAPSTTGERILPVIAAPRSAVLVHVFWQSSTPRTWPPWSLCPAPAVGLGSMIWLTAFRQFRTKNGVGAISSPLAMWGHCQVIETDLVLLLFLEKSL